MEELKSAAEACGGILLIVMYLPFAYKQTFQRQWIYKLSNACADKESGINKVIENFQIPHKDKNVVSFNSEDCFSFGLSWVGSVCNGVTHIEPQLFLLSTF